MRKDEFFLASSLEKIFLDERPNPLAERTFKVFKNDVLNLQLVYFTDLENFSNYQPDFKLEINSSLDYEIFTVDLLASLYPTPFARDENYLRTYPGLFPDLLSPFEGNFKVYPDQFRALWLKFKSKDDSPSNNFITIKVISEANVIVKTFDLSIEVLSITLSKLSIKHTQWFYADCLADYYKTTVFSEEHFKIIRNFINFAAANCSINTLLTPIFTPPLDTQVGGERTTVQLVKIKKKGESYSFDFSLLKVWCAICKDAGIETLEIAHFFTQWGAEYTPKIVVEEDGVEKPLFGWHVIATSFIYRSFLEQFIPALLQALQSFGYVKEKLLFHISDEPRGAQIDSYLKAKAVVADLLKGYTIIDALSDFEYYSCGAVSNPVPSSNHIEKFYENQVTPLWVYYCISQSVEVPNRFFSMPSARNEIMGVLFYIYNIKGFLHWGYNFYNSQYSIKQINPFLMTNSDSYFASGDAYLVYPGSDKNPMTSIRNEVQMEGFRLFEALRLLENKFDNDFVLNILHRDLDYNITFKKYPKESTYLRNLKTEIYNLLG